MKPKIKTILILLLTVYVIPGIFIFIIDKSMLWYYLVIITPAIFPYYLWTGDKKRSCRIFGREIKF